MPILQQSEFITKIKKESGEDEMEDEELEIDEVEFDEELYQKNLKENDYSNKITDGIGGDGE